MTLEIILLKFGCIDSLVSKLDDDFAARLRSCDADAKE